MHHSLAMNFLTWLHCLTVGLLLLFIIFPFSSNRISPEPVLQLAKACAANNRTFAELILRENIFGKQLSTIRAALRSVTERLTISNCRPQILFADFISVM